MTTTHNHPTTCHDCGCELHIYEQASLIAGRPAHILAECKTKGCGLYMVTLGLEKLQTMSEEKRESYREMSAKFNAR